ncbi:MAG TPA: sulfotransferase domain-containing protein, partial [Gemmatimonadales bacterium]|nr:sulfotransferase domain-containing protein [Gemmatimonadales bacterium]
KKEPHFFARDLGTYPAIKAMEDYAALFQGAEPRHRRVGEASVYYLRSGVAVPNILEFNPEARIIALFRNPVDMVHSFHSQLLYWSEEVVPDFETAWRLQEPRRRGVDVPPGSRGPFLLQYAEMARFGSQVERLLSVAPAEQVKLILYDDFAASPRGVYNEVVEFLQLPPDGRTEFPRINDNKRARVAWLRNLIRKPPPALREAYRGVKARVGRKRLDAIRQGVIERLTVKERRDPLSPDFRAELVEVFRDEVVLLGRLMGRDLAHWR